MAILGEDSLNRKQNKSPVDALKINMDGTWEKKGQGRIGLTILDETAEVMVALGRHKIVITKL